MPIDLSKSRKAQIEELVFMAIGEAMNKTYPIISSENLLAAADSCVAVAFNYALQCVAMDSENPTLSEVETVKRAMHDMINNAQPKQKIGLVT